MKKFDYKELDAEGFQTLEVIAAADRFNEWMYQTISPYCTGKILEIGSGTGNISDFFIRDNKDIILSDIRSNYCDYLTQKFNLDDARIVRNLNLTDPELEEKFAGLIGSFDTVFALNVVEHIEQDQLAIENCKRLLKPGGTLVILVPAYNFLYNTFDRELGHYRRYSVSGLAGLFRNAGLKVIKKNYFNAAGIAGWWVSGKFQKNKTIPAGQMNFYNKLVPVFKVADKLLFNSLGLSAIAVGRRPSSSK